MLDDSILISDYSLRVPISDFMKRVMEPATGKSSTTIIHGYPKDHKIRTKHTYGHLEGKEDFESAVNDYNGKVDMDVVRDRLNELLIERAKASARQFELDLENRAAHTPEMRGAAKKQEFQKMHADRIEEHRKSIEAQKQSIQKGLSSIGSKPDDLPDMMID